MLCDADEDDDDGDAEERDDASAERFEDVDGIAAGPSRDGRMLCMLRADRPSVDGDCSDGNSMSR